MEKHFAGGLFIGLCLTLVQPQAYASTVTGTVQTIRVNTGSGNVVRVSIEMLGDTACPFNGWYAFEQADSGVGKLWTDLAMTASQSGKQLIITGTDTCDIWQVEGVANIDLK
jgi:hypothetical protein